MPNFISLLFFCLAIEVLAGCNSGAKSDKFAQNKQVPSARQLKEEIEHLLRFYEPLDSFPVKVSTKAGEWEGPESKKFLWKGRPLPRQYWPLFDSLVHFDANFSEGLFANKKFQVNDHTIALLTRIPGEYWSSQVYLFLLDTRRSRLIQAYRVAESWGDAGDSFYLETEIKKLGPGLFRLETHQSECHPLDEDYQEFQCHDSLQVGLLSKDQLLLKAKRLLPKT